MAKKHVGSDVLKIIDDARFIGVTKRIVHKNKRYNREGMRMTNCCGCCSTYCDTPSGWILCCKKCWKAVGIGQGDGSEWKTPALQRKHDREMQKIMKELAK